MHALGKFTIYPMNNEGTKSISTFSTDALLFPSSAHRHLRGIQEKCQCNLRHQVRTSLGSSIILAVHKPPGGSQTKQLCLNHEKGGYLNGSRAGIILLPTVSLLSFLIFSLSARSIRPGAPAQATATLRAIRPRSSRVKRAAIVEGVIADDGGCDRGRGGKGEEEKKGSTIRKQSSDP